MTMRWRLRMAAAERGVWTAAHLRRLLASEAGYELSAPSVAALMAGEPAQVKLTTLAALCTALHCTPNDLLEPDGAAADPRTAMRISEWRSDHAVGASRARTPSLLP